jgi:hypothetical protein
VPNPLKDKVLSPVNRRTDLSSFPVIIRRNGRSCRRKDCRLLRVDDVSWLDFRVILFLLQVGIEKTETEIKEKERRLGSKSGFSRRLGTEAVRRALEIRVSYRYKGKGKEDIPNSPILCSRQQTLTPHPRHPRQLHRSFRWHHHNVHRSLPRHYNHCRCHSHHH